MRLRKAARLKVCLYLFLGPVRNLNGIEESDVEEKVTIEVPVAMWVSILLFF